MRGCWPTCSGIWSARWTGTFTPTVSGLQPFALSGQGIARLYINDQLVLSSRSALNIGAVDLRAGQPVSIRVEFVAKSASASGSVSIRLGWAPPDPAQWQAAVDASRAADVAVVFVNDLRTEMSD